MRAHISLGTWIRSEATEHGGRLSMTIEAGCGTVGRRIIYRVVGHDDVFMSIDSPMDGTDVPVLVHGKPTGQTMAIKRVDDRHAVAVMKMSGKTFGTSKATISADGTTLTVEDDTTPAPASRRAISSSSSTPTPWLTPRRSAPPSQRFGQAPSVEARCAASMGRCLCWRRASRR
jgi:hypothetical protein